MQCQKRLFCVKTIVRELGSFEQAQLKKNSLAIFWCGTFKMVFRNTGSLLGQENDEW